MVRQCRCNSGVPKLYQPLLVQRRHDENVARASVLGKVSGGRKTKQGLSVRHCFLRRRRETPSGNGGRLHVRDHQAIPLPMGVLLDWCVPAHAVWDTSAVSVKWHLHGCRLQSQGSRLRAAALGVWPEAPRRKAGNPKNPVLLYASGQTSHRLHEGRDSV
jgi:hypothetical protein